MAKLTDKQVLNMLSKSELVDAIIAVKDDRFISRIRKEMVAKYQKKMDEILEREERLTFETLDEIEEYNNLEKEYQRLQKIFDALCGV